MASIRQKPSGAWEARYRDGLGRQHAKTFPTKTLARRWAADMEADTRRGEWADPGLGRVTFAEWADEYLRTIVHLRAVTQGDYERALRVHVLPTFDTIPVARIDHVDIRRFIAEKQAEGLAPKTLQRVRLVLRQVLALAKSAGAIKSNPCDGLRLPRPARVEPVYLTAEQVEQLAQAAKPPFDVLVRLAAASGLRPSELCGLRVGRLDLDKGTIEVAEALTVVKGRTEVGPTKNSLRRTVGIPRSVCGLSRSDRSSEGVSAPRHWVGFGADQCPRTHQAPQLSERELFVSRGAPCTRHPVHRRPEPAGGVGVLS